jgi:hypothetical protein
MTEFDAWQLPDEETMTCEDGLVQNHYYRDLRWMEWSDYDQIAEDELLLLTCGHEEGSDAYEGFAIQGDNQCWYLDLDPGVASTVAALAAVGAVPVTACRGGEGHYEKYPLVAFWSGPEHKEAIEAAATQVGADLEAVLDCLVVSSSEVGTLMDFAEALEKACRK